MEQQPQVAARIMVVDDQPANLDVLGAALRTQGHVVQLFPRGRLALASAEQSPPDLILLDVNMPEMDGYEVCRCLKESARLRQIPVIFLSALNSASDKLKAFEMGAVDYISKPFQYEEVHARVDTHLRLRRAQRTEQDLLAHTLQGTIEILSGLVHGVSPVLAVRTAAIHTYAESIVGELRIDDAWQYLVASTLCLIGCVTFPEDVFLNAYAGKVLPLDEQKMYRDHPEWAARLLRTIPRLEKVADMIRAQHTGDPGPGADEDVVLGARILQASVSLDQLIFRGLPPVAALQELQKNPAAAHPSMLDCLKRHAPVPMRLERVFVNLNKLVPGMIIAEDIVGQRTGLRIVARDTVLTDGWIERLRNFSRSHGIKEPLEIFYAD